MRATEWNIESGGKEIAFSYLEVLLPGNEGKTVAHFQQVAGNVFYQLLFNIPFVHLFFGMSQRKDVRVFEQVIGKVALRSRKCGREIVNLVIADLSAIQNHRMQMVQETMRKVTIPLK